MDPSPPVGRQTAHRTQRKSPRPHQERTAFQDVRQPVGQRRPSSTHQPRLAIRHRHSSGKQEKRLRKFKADSKRVECVKKKKQYFSPCLSCAIQKPHLFHNRSQPHACSSTQAKSVQTNKTNSSPHAYENRLHNSTLPKGAFLAVSIAIVVTYLLKQRLLPANAATTD